MLKKLLYFSLLFYLFPNAYALDTQDQGEYVMMNKQGFPTTTQIRSRLLNNQWVIDIRNNNRVAWTPTCTGHSFCRLHLASPSDTQKWQELLTETSDNPISLSCIKNSAFAFCRTQNNENNHSKQHDYWFITLSTAPNIPLPLHRLK